MNRRLEDQPIWRLAILNCLLRLAEWTERGYVTPLEFVKRCRMEWAIQKPHLEDWPFK